MPNDNFTTDQILVPTQQGAPIDTLIDRVRAYDNTFTGTELKSALRWSKRRFQSAIPTVKDDFSDPLLIASEIIKFGHADRETILAAILYPTVRPVEGKGIDTKGLKEVEEKWGLPVRQLIERTLRLRALDPARPQQCKKQDEIRYRQYIRLMSLWAAQDPRAILIRSTQLAINLERYNEANARWSKEDFIWIANNIAAPLAYIAGYGKLREQIMERSYLLEDPDGYVQAKIKLKERSAQKEAERKSIEELVKDLIIKECGIGEKYITVSARTKTTASGREKTTRKGQTLEQLGDWTGFRVDIASEYFEVTGKDADLVCHQIYNVLSRHYGRGNKKNSAYRQLFEELAERDPRKDPKPGQTLDDRYDDYIKYPRPSGYSAMQDTFFVPVGDKLIECEGQIADYERWEINNYGPRTGHVYYKTDLGDLSSMVIDWYRAARIVLNGEEPEQKDIFVFVGRGLIRRVHNDRTVLDIARLQGCDSHERNNVADFVGALIQNDDPWASHHKQNFYTGNEPVHNGDRITLLYGHSQVSAATHR